MWSNLHFATARWMKLPRAPPGKGVTWWWLGERWEFTYVVTPLLEIVSKPPRTPHSCPMSRSTRQPYNCPTRVQRYGPLDTYLIILWNTCELLGSSTSAIGNFLLTIIAIEGAYGDYLRTSWEFQLLGCHWGLFSDFRGNKCWQNDGDMVIIKRMNNAIFKRSLWLLSKFQK